MTANETIIAKAYDLLKYSIPALNDLPRNQKFLLGDRIQTRLTDVLELLIRAYYAPAAKKKELLPQVNVHLEILRHFFRLGYDLGYYSSTRYHDFAARLNEIGRMTGGWLKSLK